MAIIIWKVFLEQEDYPHDLLLLGEIKAESFQDAKAQAIARWHIEEARLSALMVVRK